MYLHGVQEQN